MKFRIFLGIVVGVMVAVPLVVLGAYNDVNLSSGTTIRTTVSSATVDLTVTSGVIQSLTVESGSMDVTLASGSSIDITSTDKKNFTYNLGNVTSSFECGSSSSVLHLGLAQGQSAETVTITPQSTTCVAAGSGSGGGSSSSGSSTTSTTSTTSSTSSASSSSSSASSSSSSSSTSSATPSTTTTTTTATPSTTSTTAAVSTPVTIAAVTTPPVVISIPAVALSAELDPGERSDDVRTLQTLLASDSTIYPEGIISGYYGPKTTAAVKKFQAKYGLPQVGRVGPATMAKMNEVLGSASAPASVQSQTAEQVQSQIQSIQSQIQVLTSGTAAAFSTGMGKGDSGSMVKQLQQFLNSDPDTRIAESGIGSPGNETTLFGALTEKAVQKFQVKYGIAGPGDAGYGYIGPKTRAKLNDFSGGSATPSTPITPESPSSQAPAQSSAATASMVDQITAQIEAIQAQIRSLQGQ